MISLNLKPSDVVDALIRSLEKEEYIHDVRHLQLPSAVWRRLKEKPVSYKYCKEDADLIVGKMCELDFGLLFRTCNLSVEDASKYRGIRTLMDSQGNYFYAELKKIHERMLNDGV